MVSYPNKRCGLPPGKKSPSIWLGHAKSQSMVKKMNSMDWLVLIRLPNLVQLIHVDNKTAKHIHHKFTQSWFCQYCCPVRYFNDKGGELIGQNFHWLLEIFSIKDICSTSKNPQSNAICERMHQTVNNVQRTLVHTNPWRNMT